MQPQLQLNQKPLMCIHVIAVMDLELILSTQEIAVTVTEVLFLF